MKLLSRKIADVLEKTCPAFSRDGGAGGATWHHCYCSARDGYWQQHCTCVWHKTDTCLAGKWKWKSLNFLNIERERRDHNANKELDRAMKAVIEDNE